jgi:hypothetical protein
MVQFDETNAGSSVYAHFQSPEPTELTKAVERYILDYPEAGYMTRVEEQGQNIDGTYYIKLWRLSSC